MNKPARSATAARFDAASLLAVVAVIARLATGQAVSTQAAH